MGAGGTEMWESSGAREGDEVMTKKDATGQYSMRRDATVHAATLLLDGGGLYCEKGVGSTWPPLSQL